MFPDKDRIMQLRTMPYTEYLQTPEWARKRDRALMSDGHRCRACNSNERLEVHHRTYVRRGNEDVNDLTTLCESCHEHFHKKIDQQYLMATTYIAPIAPRSPEERRILWEEHLIGLLIHNPGLHPYVCGLLRDDDFVGKDTLALYHVLGSVYAAQAEDRQQIPDELQAIVKRVSDQFDSDVPRDQGKLVKDAVQTATRIKRNHLIQQNTDLQKQIRAASESGDVETRRRLQQCLQAACQQLRTMDAATNLQG